MIKFFHLFAQLNVIAIITVAVLIVALAVNYRKAITFYLKELIAMYSNSETFFSKKRIESGIAFLFALGMTGYYLHNKIDTMDIWSFGYVMTTWLFIAGYTVNMIQKEKKDEPKV